MTYMKASSEERMVAPGCHQVDWARKIEIVSKTCAQFWNEEVC